MIPRTGTAESSNNYSFDILKQNYSPRALAVVFVGRAFGLLNLKDFVRSLDRWLALAPEKVLRNFGPAVEELRTFPKATLTEFLRHPASKSTVTDVLADLLLKEESSEIAKRRGAVFTPAWLARRVTRIAYQHWFRLHRSGKSPRVVADLACGPGAFLFACEEVFSGRSTRILGVDNNPSCLAYAELLAFASLAKWELRCEDTLLDHITNLPLFTPKRSFVNDEERIDILVGNPPFVRSQLLPKTYTSAIRSGYPSTRKGNFDLSIPFIEHAINALEEGGVAAYILTNKFMTSIYGKIICQKLATDVRILSLEDFQDKQVFQGYTTYTCVLTFAKKGPAKRFLVTRFPNGLNGGHDPGPGKTISLPTERLMHHPWDFASDDVSSILGLLRNNSHPLLGEVFGNIIQGLRTGANQVFVVESSSKLNIESTILVPFINGEHIRRCRVQSDRLRLIFPYKVNHFGEAIIYSEQELRENFPKCWAYLQSHQSVLLDRARDLHSPWYAYSRSQNLLLGRLKKLLVREMMPRAEFAADISGRLTFASGYGLDASRMNDDDLRMWTAILCTPTMEFALRYNGTQLQSGWFRLLKHHLRRVRLPLISRNEYPHIQKITSVLWKHPDDADTLEALDLLISRAFGLSNQNRNLIKGFLDDCHERSLGRSAKSAGDTQAHSKVQNTIDIYEPVKLNQYNQLHRERPDLQRAVTFVPNKDLPVHRWFKYSQGFSAEVVEFLINDLRAADSSVVLDPFTGCGTTNVVCRQRGIASIGVEISPLMAWVAQVKMHTWIPNELEELISHIELPSPKRCHVHTYEHSPFAEYLTKAYSSRILEQLWTFAHVFDSDFYASHDRAFLKLGLLSIMEEVSQIRKHGSHYRFMLKTDSIGLQKLNIPIISSDADIRPVLIERLRMMVNDVRIFTQIGHVPKWSIIQADARQLPLKSATITTVISSPPYLNRNNYIAQQKAELAILSLVADKKQYRDLVQNTLRSHVEARFPSGSPHSEFPEVQKIIASLELSINNNPKIPHMIAGYFNDLSHVLQELHRVIVPGGQLAFVVGNSRWGGVVVPVDHLLSLIAEKTGFVLEKIYVTRHKGNSPQQMRKYGRIPVRESIVVARRK